MENLTLAVKSALSNYATFSGRAARPAYWWWVLSVFLLMLVLNALDSLVIGPMLGFGVSEEDAGQPLSALVSLALILPNIAIGVRRLHDSGRTGWWMLVGLIPLVGVLALIYFFVQPSETGENAYGPRPVWPPAAA